MQIVGAPKTMDKCINAVSTDMTKRTLRNRGANVSKSDKSNSISFL